MSTIANSPSGFLRFHRSSGQIKVQEPDRSGETGANALPVYDTLDVYLLGRAMIALEYLCKDSESMPTSHAYDTAKGLLSSRSLSRFPDPFISPDGDGGILADWA